MRQSKGMQPKNLGQKTLLSCIRQLIIENIIIFLLFFLWIFYVCDIHQLV